MNTTEEKTEAPATEVGQFEQTVEALNVLKAEAMKVKDMDAADPERYTLAKSMAKVLQQARLAVDKRRKELKEYFIQGGKTVEAKAKTLLAIIGPEEEFMDKIVEEVDAAKKKEKLRKERLVYLPDLKAQISKFSHLREFTDDELLDMPELDFCKTISDLTQKENERLAAENKAAADREAAQHAAQRQAEAIQQATDSARQAEQDKAAREAREAQERAEQAAERERLEKILPARLEVLEGVMNPKDFENINADAKDRLARLTEDVFISKVGEIKEKERVRLAEEMRQKSDRDKIRAWAESLLAVPVPEIDSDSIMDSVKEEILTVIRKWA